MDEQTRSKQYPHLKNMLNEHEHDINRCLQLINKVKEHRHEKSKGSKSISLNIYI